MSLHLSDYRLVDRGQASLGATLLANRQAADVLTALGWDNEDGGTYRLFNPFNPEQPLLESSPGTYTVRPGWDRHPVVGMSWDGATRLAAALGLRLPTVAELTAAAGRGKFPWGDEPLTPDRANYGEHIGSTTRVDAHPLTGEGFHDLVGNLAEWTCTPNSRSPLEAMVVGGGWNKPPAQVPIRHHRSKWKRVGTMSIGFRLAKDTP